MKVLKDFKLLYLALDYYLGQKECFKVWYHNQPVDFRQIEEEVAVEEEEAEDEERGFGLFLLISAAGIPASGSPAWERESSKPSLFYAGLPDCRRDGETDFLFGKQNLNRKSGIPAFRHGKGKAKKTPQSLFLFSVRPL